MASYISLLVFVFGVAVSASAQKIQSHKWQNRVVVLTAADAAAPAMAEQLKILTGDKNGLAERKIIVYQIYRNGFRTGLTSSTSLRDKSTEIDLDIEDHPFSILLIGLDGGVKLKSDSVLSLVELFSVIDAMPMRLSEMAD